MIDESPFKGEERIEEVFKSTEISKENSQFPKEVRVRLGENSSVEEENRGQDMEGYVILDHYETYLLMFRQGDRMRGEGIS